MKKTLYFLFAAAILMACEPTTTDNQSILADSFAAQARLDSIKADSIFLNDLVDSVMPPPSYDSIEGGNQNANGGGEIGEKGRMANPNIDLNAKTFKVTGHITIVKPYCGGAAPSKEILAESRKAQPYAKQALLVRKGKTNALSTGLVTRAVTDANGDFSLQLPDGDYCIVLVEKENARAADFNANGYMVIDEKCDSKWLTQCEMSFTVANKNVSGLRLGLEKKCMLNTMSPCITYDGPLPPAAAPRGK